MGAVQSGDKKSLYDYSQWRLRDVKQARIRVNNSGVAPDDSLAVFMTRKQFWECFTDYSVIRQGQFLSVPLALFEVFKSAEHKDTDMVNVIEVLLILALFCTGDVRDQLMFCFELFDDDNSDSMDQEEMTNFLWVLASASNKIGMVDPMPTRREVHKVAGGMFALADVGNKGTESGLSSQHFINWAQNHVIGSAILDSVEKVREDEAKQRGGDELDARAYANQFAAAVMTREREKKLQGRKMMGNLVQTTKFDVKELRTLRAKFEEKASDETKGDGDGLSQVDHLTKAQFCEAIVEAYPHLEGADDVNLESLFDTFDGDGGGTIDFKEFTLGISKLTKGSMTEKLEFLFEIYDRNGDGTIDVAELMKFVQRGNNNLADELRFTEEVVDALDKDGDGSISRAEFTKSLLDEPLLYECFAKALVVEGLDREVVAQFMLLTGANARCDLYNLKKVWEKHSGRARAAALNGTADTAEQAKSRAIMKELGVKQEATDEEKANAKHEAAGNIKHGGMVYRVTPAHNHVVDLDSFLEFMKVEFEVLSEPAHTCLKGVWAAVNPDNEPLVPWKSVFSGLAQVMAGTLDDKASFYFSLHDTDGNGDMDKSEILGLILSSQQAAAAAAQKAVGLLTQLDQDGDGQITFQEFKVAAKAAPKVLDCLRKLLGGDKDTTSISDKGRLKAMKQREMVQEVSSLFGFSRSAKFAKLQRATKLLVQKRNKRKGIQTLRKLSITTLNTTVAALQGQHSEVAAASEASKMRKVPSFYELPAASLAAQVYSKEVTKRIGNEAKAIRRAIHVHKCHSRWAKLQGSPSSKTLRKTATIHNLVDSRPATTQRLHGRGLRRAGTSGGFDGDGKRHVKFADGGLDGPASQWGVSEGPSMASLGSFYSQGSSKDLAPRFRLRRVPSRHAQSRPHTSQGTGPHSAAALVSGVGAGAGAGAGAHAPEREGGDYAAGQLGTLRGSPSGLRRVGSVMGSSRQLHSLGGGGGGSLNRQGHASWRDLHTAHGSRRRLNQLLHGSDAPGSSSPRGALPLSDGSRSHSRQDVLRSTTSFVRRSRGGQRRSTSPQSPGRSPPLTAGIGMLGRLHGHASGRLGSPMSHSGSPVHKVLSPAHLVSSPHHREGPTSSPLLDFGLGDAIVVEPMSPNAAKTIGKKRAIARPQRDTSIRSSTTRQVFGFRPD